MSDEIELVCPECGGNRVAVTLEQMIMVNTGEHHCYSVRAHDNDAKVQCLSCRWLGRRDALVERLDA